MKKTFLFVATAALFVLSCQKEVDPEKSTSKDASFAFKATVQDFTSPTKANINNDRRLVWATGDKIGIFVDEDWGENQYKSNPFTLVGDGGTSAGSFIWDYYEGAFTSTQAKAAYFPWQGRDNAGTYNNFWNGTFYIKLAGSYGGATDVDTTPYTSGKMLTPLVAAITRTGDAYDPIQFEHAGGAVKVKVSDLPAGARSMGMIADGQQIHGSYQIAVANAGSANMTLSGDAVPGNNSIWLNIQPAADARPFTFLFPVPALGENVKLTFKIYDKNDVLVWSRSVSSHEAINHGDLLLLGSDEAISIEPYRQLKEVSSEWGVCGSFTSWGSDSDIEMMTDGESCVVKGIELEANAQFKIRTKGSWDSDFGSGALINSETYAEDSDGNIKIKSDGEYDIVFNISQKKIHVAPTGECPYPSQAHHYTAIKNATALPIGTTETANCYVITTAGSYKIPVVKGNSSESAGTVGGVDLLWETYNNATNVTPNSVIEAVDWDEREPGYIFFKTPATLQPGNALIAAKNAAGEIIWSWHIWIPATTYTTSTFGYIYNHELMDRNLGALVAATTSSVPVESYGLNYQWGRKDPFVGQGDISSNSGFAKRSGTAMTLSTSAMTVAETIANPTVFSIYSSTSSWGPWLNPADDTPNLWKDSEKTVYDPCPAGFRVPTRNTSQLLHSSDLSTVKGWSDNAASGDNAPYFALGNPATVFPYTGLICENGQYVDYPAGRTYIWTSTTSGNNAYHMDVRVNSSHTVGSTVTSRGGSVRCVKIEEVEAPIPSPATGIELDGVFTDWADGDANQGDGSKIIEWKYAYDASNLYFYYKIPTSKITAKDDGSYNNKYIYIALDTDNKTTTGGKPGYGGHTITGCEALALVYPFRGNTTDGLSFANGEDSGGWTRVPVDGSRTGKYVTAYGAIDGSYALLEIGIPWDGLGSPSKSKMKLEFSYSWDLAGIYTIEYK